MSGPALSPELAEVLARTRLLALDVDGTLTDGRVVYVGERELQAFYVRDGLGLVWLARAGVTLAWITGRGCRATERRADELGVSELHMWVSSKRDALAGVQERLGLAPADTVAMGDDLPDLGMAERAALFACPGNATEEVRERAALVTRAPGGAGAVRELAEAILRAKGLWQATLGRYGPPAV